MKTNLFRILAAAVILVFTFVLPSNSPNITKAVSHSNQIDQITFLPLVVRGSTLPQSWQLVYDMLDHYRLVVPQDWTVDEIPEPSSPLRSYHSLDNIPNDWPGLPPDIGGPDWPTGLYKIEIMTFEQVLDPQRTFEENARLLIEDGLTLVTGYTIDPAYPNGTFIELGQQGVPAYHGSLFATTYASEGGLRLLTVATYPSLPLESWNEPVIQFIVNSLEFD